MFIEHLLMFDGVSAEKVIDIPLDARFARRFGNPYAVTHRADIHGSLLDGCKALPELIELRTSARVTGFEQDGSKAVKTEKGDIEGAALVAADGGRSVIRERIVGDPLPPVTGHMCYRAVLNIGEVPKELRLPAATLWAGHNAHIVHYSLRGWKLFNLVATVIGKHTSGGHNELATPQEALPFFAHYCDQVMKLMRTPKEFRRWMLLYRQPVDNWTQGRVALGDAAHFMLQYMAQGAAMAMEDAVALGVAAEEAGGDFPAGVPRVSGHAHRARFAGAALRQHARRHDLPRARWPRAPGAQRHLPRPPAERYYDALEWVFSAPEYVRNFNAKQVRADLRARTNPAKLHRAHQLARQDLERAQRSRLAGRHRAKERRAAGEHRLRAERARFQDVHAAAHAAVEQHGHAVSYRARDRRQRIQGRGGAIELPAAVVGHDDTVAADGRCALGVVRALHAFEEQLPGHWLRSA